MSRDEKINFEVFRDCLSVAVIEKSGAGATGRGPKRKSKQRSSNPRPQARASLSGSHWGAQPSHWSQTASNDPSELADFIDYVAEESFSSLPQDLQALSYHGFQKDPILAETYSPPLTLTTIEDVVNTISPSVSDTLMAYGLITPPTTDLASFFAPVLAAYISAVTTQPPPPSSTRTSQCEICERHWIPLTYHHLIPKQVHTKALNRGWHEEHELNSVAWLCRACHSFVHRMASNEELAKEWWSVERIVERDDVQKWAAWVGNVRWKKR